MHLSDGWPEAGLARLKGAGFATAAMALTDDSCAVDDPKLKAMGKLAIVLGTEGDGLSHETIARCDVTVKIPMSHGVDPQRGRRQRRGLLGNAGKVASAAGAKALEVIAPPEG